MAVVQGEVATEVKREVKGGFKHDVKDHQG
jgi:hypothetical protein